VYRFLAYDAEIFLPHFRSVTVWHLRDLASGKRRPIKASAVKTINVPHYSSLNVETMLHHARNWPAVARALPGEPSEVEKLPRAYIANVIYTVVGVPFRQWVDAEVKKRNDKIVEEGNLGIEMDDDIYQAFIRSKHVSTSNGISSHLMKVSQISNFVSQFVIRHPLLVDAARPKFLRRRPSRLRSNSECNRWKPKCRRRCKLGVTWNEHWNKARPISR
jgi:hypothetical protein